MKKYDEELRYYKKRPWKSWSSRRSDHKHDYEKVILQAVIGWTWGGRCRICGRLDNKWGFHSNDFLKPEYRNKPGICRQDFYSEAELKTVFPGVAVYKYDRLTDLGYTLCSESENIDKDTSVCYNEGN